MTTRWQPGTVITRREVLGFDPIETERSTAPWRGACWMEMPVTVVADTPDELVVYVAPRTPFTFPPGAWPTTDGRHPWHGTTGWRGHGCLMVQRPGDHHAIWHCWEHDDRRFARWYVNLQTAFRRSHDAIDTQDLELDLVVAPDGTWAMKGWDLLDQRVAEGRYSTELVAWVRRLGVRLGRDLDAGLRWWGDQWAEWTPDELSGNRAGTCVGCGAADAPRHDTPNGRVALCNVCASEADLGCP